MYSTYNMPLAQPQGQEAGGWGTHTLSHHPMASRGDLEIHANNLKLFFLLLF
jgi:hypothetical protein